MVYFRISDKNPGQMRLPASVPVGPVHAFYGTGGAPREAAVLLTCPDFSQPTAKAVEVRRFWHDCSTQQRMSLCPVSSVSDSQSSIRPSLPPAIHPTLLHSWWSHYLVFGDLPDQMITPLHFPLALLLTIDIRLVC